MRVLGLMVIAGFGCSVLQTAESRAAENFIPKGYSYSPDRTVLPNLNSRQDRIVLQADIVESEIDKSQRLRKLQDNEFSRFLYSQSLEGVDFYRLDY